MFGLFKKKKAVMPAAPALTLNPSCVHSCLKEKCPKWLVLYQDVVLEGKKTPERVPVGKCADVWLPMQVIELREEIVKMNEILSGFLKQNKKIELPIPGNN